MPAPTIPAIWRQYLFILSAVIGWVFYCYWGTAVAMVQIWARSDTYAHAFLVPPISLWLIWRQRSEVIQETPRASLLLTWPLAVSGILWLLGELTSVNALTQFALVATLVAAIMSTLGIAVSRQIAFPLAFLFFAVPFGDFMMPQLMEWTATFTVMALRATGIPVYQEGLQFVIPSGNWSVVEACSGIRYIIASLTVGTLFAYLTYSSLRRRVVFILISLLVPVIANWLRAYMIVMLGHFSSNKLAVGVDHLIYGWVFFGIVITIMFVVGARWAEDPQASLTQHSHKTILNASQQLPIAALIVALALIATGPFYYSAINNHGNTTQPSIVDLPDFSGWKRSRLFHSWTPEYANPSFSKHEMFENEEHGVVGIFVGYYRQQNYERKLITSTNTLASSNNKVWSVLSTTPEAIDSPGLPKVISKLELLGREGVPDTRLTVWKWYWINGKLTSSDVMAKAYTALSRLSGQGDDSAVIMIYSPAAQSESMLSRFSKDIAPSLNQWLAESGMQP